MVVQEGEFRNQDDGRVKYNFLIFLKKVLDLKVSLKNERVKSMEQTESALKEQSDAFRAERQALEAEVARFRGEAQKMQGGLRFQ